MTRSKLPFSQAAAMFSNKWLPGKSGIGTWLTVWKSWLAATKTIHSGIKQRDQAEDQQRVRECVEERRAFDHGRSPVVDAPLDEAELDEGERDDQEHQHDRLRGGQRIVLALKTVGIDLVDHQVGGARRTA